MIPVMLSMGGLRGKGMSDKVFNMAIIAVLLVFFLLLACSCGAVCLAIGSVVVRTAPLV